MMQYIKVKKVIQYCLLLVCTLVISCGKLEKLTTISEIGIYTGNGVWNQSATALESMFKWMGYRVSTISADELNSNEIIYYKLFCMPDGDFEKMAASINGSGRESIREFVNNGGAMIATGAGSYFASEMVVINEVQSTVGSTTLFEGVAEGPVEGLHISGQLVMAELDVRNQNSPVTNLMPSKMWMLYSHGPSFQSFSTNSYTTLASYVMNGSPAIIGFEYGQGRVFLSGVNPEFEENHPRDSVNFESELVDPESDWQLMRNAVEWCLATVMN